MGTIPTGGGSNSDPAFAVMKKYPPHLDVTFAEPTGDFCLRLRFSDGVFKEVNTRDLLEGAVFEPLKDPEFFRQVTLDQNAGTVVWPNGADIAPEALWDLPDLAIA